MKTQMEELDGVEDTENAVLLPIQQVLSPLPKLQATVPSRQHISTCALASTHNPSRIPEAMKGLHSNGT